MEDRYIGRNFIYIQCINWSCMSWRPSLCIVFLQARKQITNKYTEIIAGFLFCAVFSTGRLCYIFLLYHCSWPFNRECWWYPYFIVSYSIYVPDTVRYCITLPYSMLFFLFFFVFCTIHKHKMWGRHILYWDTGLWGERRCRDEIEWRWEMHVESI